MPLKLYVDYSSQPSRAVLALCLLGKVQVEVVEIRIMQMQMRTEEFAKINPQRKVPALEDTESKLSMGESHAMMRYICGKFHLEEQWYPLKDLVRQAKINQYLDFHHTATRKCSYLIFNSLFAKKIGMVDPTFVPEVARKAVHHALKHIDSVFLANSDYIVGSQCSIADLSAFYEIEFLMLLDFDFSKFPLLQKWMGRMNGIKQVKQANQKFYKIAPKLKGQTAKL